MQTSTLFVGNNRLQLQQFGAELCMAPWAGWVKVAFDGEVAMMRAPLDFQVRAKPLYLLKPHGNAAVIDVRSSAEGAAP